MNKIIGIFIVTLLISASFIGAAVKKNSLNEEIIKTDYYFKFSNPEIKHIDNKITLNIIETNSVLNKPDKPIIPIYKETIIYPHRTQIQSIEISPPNLIHRGHIYQQIISAPNSFKPYSKDISSKITKTIYQSDLIYPNSWYEYSINHGLFDGKPSIIVNLVLCPIRLLGNQIFYINDFNVKINIKQNKEYQKTSNEENLLIIAPEIFINPLDEFVTHKESKGISTSLVNLESIYDGTYFPVEGRDDAEKVKYFIKNAYDEWDIKYVLLVGGLKPGLIESYFVPVRYVNVEWGESKYISDLYFADIYNSDDSFSTWDTDNNNIFCEWKYMRMLEDQVDLYPEVFIGRWPCRNVFELNIMIQKSIEYENMQTSNKIVLVGGDNFEGEGIEGEIVCDKSLDYLDGFEYEKVYSSEMDVNLEDIKNALGDGSLFVHFHGHGGPLSWSTHPPDNFDVWLEGIDTSDLPSLSNGEYPIIILGGCHTSLFNVSFFNRPFVYGLKFIVEDIAWWFTRKIGGGGIASLGYTCFPVAYSGEYGDLDGNGVTEPDCLESGYGYIELQFVKGFGIEKYELLGDCWAYAINTYLEAFKTPNWPEHFHTVQGFILMGDPTLKIGGYD
jgi:hypothetical protein